MKHQYEIQRIMNNNVILAKTLDTSAEMVLMGKGIGFGKKKGQRVDESDLVIEKAFKAGMEGSLKDSYLRMLKEVNGSVVEICTEILLVAEKKLGNLSERSFIVVVDHISFAIEKLEQKIAIENPFVHEILQLYPEEFAIGELARKKILEKLHVDITEDEVGFIAMHLHAAKENVGVKDTLRNTRIIKEIIALIERELLVDLEKYPQDRLSLLMHLRGTLSRIDRDIQLEKHSLHDQVIGQCPKAYRIALEISTLLTREKKHPTVADTFYLTLHIDRLIRITSDTE